MDIEDGEITDGDPLPKASSKKKPPKPEESKSKKEHVNVVFIGHVGELFFCDIVRAYFVMIESPQMLANPQSEDKLCRSPEWSINVHSRNMREKLVRNRVRAGTYRGL